MRSLDEIVIPPRRQRVSRERWWDAPVLEGFGPHGIYPLTRRAAAHLVVSIVVIAALAVWVRS